MTNVGHDRNAFQDVDTAFRVVRLPAEVRRGHWVRQGQLGQRLQSQVRLKSRSITGGTWGWFTYYICTYPDKTILICVWTFILRYNISHPDMKLLCLWYQTFDLGANLCFEKAIPGYYSSLVGLSLFKNRKFIKIGVNPNKPSFQRSDRLRWPQAQDSAQPQVQQPDQNAFHCRSQN
jgi:hypothetical protein